MVIAIAGISGFTGSELKRFFESREHQVIGIPRALSGDPARLNELAGLISRAEVVVNLSGANIIRRHHRKNRELLTKSRILTTQHLVAAMQIASPKPSLFISASATGIYKPHQEHDEFQMEICNGFLGLLCVQWENEAFRASSLNIRTVILRSGIILGKQGGVVKKLLPIFKSGLGAVILPAKSSFPWIHIRDFTEICNFFIEHPDCSGAYNLTVERNITQKEFAKAFARALHRPLLFVIPSFALRLLFGKGADNITKNPVVKPVRLINAGYQFRFNSIEEAMADICRR